MPGKVTVVGAGFYGSTTAMRLAEYNVFDEVVLTDIVEGKAEGLALDMNQSRPVEGFETKVVGQTTGLRESSMLTQDETIVDIRFTVQDRLKDAKNFLFENRDTDNAVVQASEELRAGTKALIERAAVTAQEQLAANAAEPLSRGGRKAHSS